MCLSYIMISSNIALIATISSLFTTTAAVYNEQHPPIPKKLSLRGTVLLT